MPSSELVRWSGLAAMLGGALWSIGFNFVGWGEPGTPVYERYEAYNRLLPLALLPVTAGIVGLHAVQRGSYGPLGKAGFVAVLVGLAIAGSVGEFWVFTEQPYGVAGGRDASWTIYLLGHLILAIGSVLFGIATMRAGILPRSAAMLFAMLGAAAVVPVTGAILFAIPFIWLGYALWSGGYATMRQPASVE